MLNLKDGMITITHEGIVVPKKEPVLVPNTHPLLHTKLEPFIFENQHSINLAIETSNTLIKAMQKFGGWGLSANQLGLPHRVFVMGTDENLVAYFNPEITYASGEVVLAEGCLSFMGLFLKINRPQAINIRYQDYEGKLREGTLVGLSARCFQHELDHLNGIVFTSHVGPLALKMAKDKQKKLEKMHERRSKTATGNAS